MGTGKTTLGRAMEHFAASDACDPALSGLTFVDLDEFIERHERMSIPEIFRTKGEPYFRELERSLLRQAAGNGSTPVLVGCGGGTPCQPGCMEWMNAAGLTVKLEASPHVLLRRLMEADGQRPLTAGISAEELAAFITAKQAEREPFYELAQLRFRSDRLESEEEINESCRLFADLVLPHITP